MPQADNAGKHTYFEILEHKDDLNTNKHVIKKLITSREIASTVLQ